MLKKITSIFLWLLFGISALIFVLYVADVLNEGVFISWSYVLFGIALLSVVAFAVFFAVTNFRRTRTALIGIVAIVIICFISYAIASDELVKVQSADIQKIMTNALSKNVGMGIFTMYILFAISVVAILYTEVIKIFK